MMDALLGFAILGAIPGAAYVVRVVWAVLPWVSGQASGVDLTKWLNQAHLIVSIAGLVLVGVVVIVLVTGNGEKDPEVPPTSTPTATQTATLSPTPTPTATPSLTPTLTQTPPTGGAVPPAPIPPTAPRPPTPVPPTAPPPTVPPLPEIDLEGEFGVGSGQVKERSEASGARTILLQAGESRTLSFDLIAGARYRLNIRYSNDNANDLPSELVAVAVDGDLLGQFVPQDTGDDGFGWNVFAWSDIVGVVDLSPGHHEVVLSVTGGDGFGVEIDVVALVLAQ